MRFTKKHYQTAIENLKEGMKQLEPDGHDCSVCGDSGHMAFECGFNPLVAMHMCDQISKDATTFHETLHWFSGYQSMFGVQVGPAKVVTPERQIEAEKRLSSRSTEKLLP